MPNHRVRAWSGPDAPPLDDLVTEATLEGVGFVERTVARWIDGSNRFDEPGESFFLACEDGTAVGMGGLNIDPYADVPDLGRIRHLYVSPTRRRTGIATEVVRRCLAHARGTFDRVRLRTTDRGAAAFYESIGFEPVEEPDATHAFILGR